MKYRIGSTVLIGGEHRRMDYEGDDRDAALALLGQVAVETVYALDVHCATEVGGQARAFDRSGSQLDGDPEVIASIVEDLKAWIAETA
jgi:hypothetical protein